MAALWRTGYYGRPQLTGPMVQTKTFIYVFLPTILGPIYYGPPSHKNSTRCCGGSVIGIAGVSTAVVHYCVHGVRISVLCVTAIDSPPNPRCRCVYAVGRTLLLLSRVYRSVP